jgi:hypothetical protein
VYCWRQARAYTYSIFYNILLAREGMSTLVPSAFSDATMKSLPTFLSRNTSPSAMAVLLIIIQSVALISLVPWFVIFNLLIQSGHVNDDVIFLLYPTIPVVLCSIGWIYFTLRNYQRAIIFSVIPSGIAFALLAYFFFKGVW